jgi:hypothetical protein
MDNQQLFFNRIGSICTHAEEMIGTDLFIKITLNKTTVNPSLTFPSTVIYLNTSGKLKMYPNYTFQFAQLRNDDWTDQFIDEFIAIKSDCKEMVGVITSSNNLNWYIEFVTSIYGSQAIERNGQQILL